MTPIISVDGQVMEELLRRTSKQASINDTLRETLGISPENEAPAAKTVAPKANNAAPKAKEKAATKTTAPASQKATKAKKKR